MRQHIRRRRRGANAVEFAMILPIFLTVYFGVMEFGYFFFEHAAVVNATRDGCREGALYSSTDPIHSAKIVAEDTIYNNLLAASIDCSIPGRCTITCDYEGVAETLSVKCDVDVQYSPIIGFIPIVPSNHLTTSINVLETR